MMFNLFYRRLFSNLVIILSIVRMSCGKVPTPNSLVDGDDARPHQFPFIVSINGTYEGPASTGTTYGAGVLIAERFVLTIKPVAFMMEGKDAVQEKVLTVFPKYGDNLRDPVYSEQKPLRVEKKICMKKNNSPYSPELVVLKLKDAPSKYYGVQTIKISPDLEKKKYRFKIAGWGMTQRGNFSSKRGKLQEAEITIKYECPTKCPLVWDIEDTGDTVSTCYGDEGGPVVTKHQPNLLVGLLLEPRKDCSESTVLNILAHRDWIQQVIKGGTQETANCLAEKKVGMRKEGDSSKEKKKEKEKGGDKKDKKSQSKGRPSLKLEINLKNSNNH